MDGGGGGDEAAGAGMGDRQSLITCIVKEVWT